MRCIKILNLEESYLNGFEKIETNTSKESINEFIDHTLLKSNATKSEIEKLCEEAILYKFKAVCVNFCRFSECKNFLKNSNVKIAGKMKNQ
jgi:deoxyribose-phosphate aldolase